jgi:hypothetical protein
MKISNAAAALAAATVSVALAMTSLAATAVSAAPSPAARTCAAFRTWSAHQSGERMDTLVTDSVTAPWHPLGADVVVLYTDARDGDTLDRASDVASVAADCAPYARRIVTTAVTVPGPYNPCAAGQLPVSPDAGHCQGAKFTAS